MFTYKFLKHKITKLFPNPARDIFDNIYVILTLILLASIIFIVDIITIPLKIIIFICLVIKEEV